MVLIDEARLDSSSLPVTDRRAAGSLPTPIFNISRRLEGVMITPFRNFEEYQSIHGTVTRSSSREEWLQEDPYTMLLSIPRMSVLKNHDNSLLVKKVLSA